MRAFCLSILLLSAAGCSSLPPFRDLPAPTAENILTGGLLLGRIAVTLDGKPFSLNAEGRVAYVVFHPVHLGHSIDQPAAVATAAAHAKTSARNVILRCPIDPKTGLFMLALPLLAGSEYAGSAFEVTGVSIGLVDTQRKTRAPVRLINFPLDDEIPWPLSSGLAWHAGVIKIDLRSRQKTEATEDSQRLLECELIAIRRVWDENSMELELAVEDLRRLFPGLSIQSKNSSGQAAVIMRSF